MMRQRSRTRERLGCSRLRARRRHGHRGWGVRLRVYPRQGASLSRDLTTDDCRRLLRLEHVDPGPQPDRVPRRGLLAGRRRSGSTRTHAAGSTTCGSSVWQPCSGSCRRSSGRSSTSFSGPPIRSTTGATVSSTTAPSRSGSPSATFAARCAAGRSIPRSSCAPSARLA